MKITNVMASSVDSFIGAKPNESDEERQNVSISSKVDFDHLINLMSEADAIFVGASSIRANKECLELLGQQNPHWYIFTNNEISADMKFWCQTNVPRTIVSSKDLTLHNTDVELIKTPHTDPKKIVADLVETIQHMDYKNILLFGGGEVNSWFYELGLVDELCLTIAPVIVASKVGSHFVNPCLPSPVKLKLSSLAEDSGYLFLKYQIIKS